MIMNATQPLIELQDVSRVFRTETVETHALRGISLNIEPGEFIAITGPSGCGKSTLLSLLGLLDQPSSGAYRLTGHETSRLPAGERARLRNLNIGFIFQSFNLIDELTACGNVALPLEFRGLPKSERRERAAEALRGVGMESRMDHFPAQLSGGQQQRVAIARALGGKPRLILADAHRDGSTVLMVTHSEQCAARAGRRLHMRDGSLVTHDNVRA